MMRVCHLDTCPVGVATQNTELRSKFSGKPEFVINFFEFIAEEVREHLAALGFRSLAEAIGHVEVLDTTRAEQHWKAHGLELRPILHKPDLAEDTVLHNTTVQDHGIAEALDQELIRICRPALETGEAIRASLPIRNVDRTVGTILGHEVTKATSGEGLPDGTIDITLEGSAGQSFGAFLPAGITLRLEGDANDYLAKGLSGGRIVVRPARTARFVAADNIIAGNVIAYGATSGELFIRGQVGERFCVRNSGAIAVVEGLGDHGCEYMTGGIAVVLGKTGRNVAAGMSGGIGYFLDLDPTRLNTEMVDALVPTEADLEFLRKLIVQHREETDSDVARSLLTDWHAAGRRFTKVLPRDYARVIAARQQGESEGLDEAMITTKMMEAAHG
jgi:glutamate synthase (NADPH/NADH) large chain